MLDARALAMSLAASVDPLGSCATKASLIQAQTFIAAPVGGRAPATLPIETASSSASWAQVSRRALTSFASRPAPDPRAA
jgi:hypothetical protein